ncbi:hypothetical protein EMIT0P253_20259 [Pseudomonas sp. IT-P253]
MHGLISKLALGSTLPERTGIIEASESVASNWWMERGTISNFLEQPRTSWDLAKARSGCEPDQPDDAEFAFHPHSLASCQDSRVLPIVVAHLHSFGIYSTPGYR